MAVVVMPSKAQDTYTVTTVDPSNGLYVHRDYMAEGDTPPQLHEAVLEYARALRVRPEVQTFQVFFNRYQKYEGGEEEPMQKWVGLRLAKLASFEGLTAVIGYNFRHDDGELKSEWLPIHDWFELESIA